MLLNQARTDQKNPNGGSEANKVDALKAKIEAERQAREAKEAQKKAEAAAKKAEQEAARIKAESEKKMAQMKAEREQENKRRQAEIEEAQRKAREEAERKVEEAATRKKQEEDKKRQDEERKRQEEEAAKRQQRNPRGQPASSNERERSYTEQSAPEFGQIPVPTEHQCQEASQRGQCLSNALFMAAYCPKHCDALHQKLEPCTDYDDNVCSKWADRQECERSAIYMSLNCARSCYKWLVENNYQSAPAYGQTHGCSPDALKEATDEVHHGTAQHMKGIPEDQPEEEMKAAEAAQQRAEAESRLERETREKEMLANEINQIKAQADPPKSNEDVDVRQLEEDIEAHERAVAALRAKREEKNVERKTFTGGHVRSYGTHQEKGDVMDYDVPEDEEDEDETINDNITEELNKDINDISCKRAAEKGQCQVNALFMAANCPHSCQAVREDGNNCTDFNLEQCLAWAAQGECEKSALYLSKNCPETCWKTLTEKNHMYAKNYGTTHGCT